MASIKRRDEDPSSPSHEDDSSAEDATTEGEPPRPAAPVSAPASTPALTIPAPPPVPPASSTPILAISDGTLVEEDEPTGKHPLTDEVKPPSR